jgi:hypothetical protein
MYAAGHGPNDMFFSYWRLSSFAGCGICKEIRHSDHFCFWKTFVRRGMRYFAMNLKELKAVLREKGYDYYEDKESVPGTNSKEFKHRCIFEIQDISALHLKELFK